MGCTVRICRTAQFYNVFNCTRPKSTVGHRIQCSQTHTRTQRNKARARRELDRKKTSTSDMFWLLYATSQSDRLSMWIGLFYTLAQFSTGQPISLATLDSTNIDTNTWRLVGGGGGSDGGSCQRLC